MKSYFSCVLGQKVLAKREPEKIPLRVKHHPNLYLDLCEKTIPLKPNESRNPLQQKLICNQAFVVTSVGQVEKK